MFELFYAGGAFYMGILTLILVAMLAVAVINGILVLKDEMLPLGDLHRKLSHIKSVGLFAFMLGVLFQLMGLMGAFNAIEEAGSASPALLAGGLKVSMISTIYGLIIYVISYLIWLALTFNFRKRAGR